MSTLPGPVSDKTLRFLPILGILAALVLHLLTLSNRPMVFVDEAVTLSRVLSLLNHGSPNGEFDDAVYGDDGAIEVYHARSIYYFFATPSLFGISPSITTVRFMTLLASLGIAAAIGSIAATAFGRQSGLTAAFFALISPGFVYSSHVARPDAVAAALGYLAIAAFLTPNRKPMLAGFISVLAFSAHQRAVILTAALIALLCFDLYRTKSTIQSAMRMLLGACGAVFVLIAVDILPYYEQFLATQALVAKAVPPPAIAHGTGIVMLTLGEFLKLVISIYPFAWPLLLLLLARPFQKLSMEIAPLAVLISATIIMSLLCVHGMVIVKSIFFVPAIDLLFAMLLYYWVNHPQQRWLSWGLGLAFVLVIFMSLMGFFMA